MIETGILFIYASICIISASIGCCMGAAFGFAVGRYVKEIIFISNRGTK